ncbi:helix-turn-helix domain-containing protein [Rhizobium sp. L1K21]|uniref:helix-turn-helix domain-containing protein n=1 Tax=Rhizobium sp. L1K21 TaxID=2954933 RepID=UPI002092E000|nr:helix-turn-helix domain-containing protein [Rhizobium sp. L1K21]MCO6185466.1 GAF domain-containing protein [Rhizobium sp. L1K21]
MLDSEKHADRVYSTAEHSSAAASSPIAASWRRCVSQHKLAPEVAREPQRLGESEFHHVRERSSFVIEEATGEMDRLFSMTAQSGFCVLLTDENGVVLDRRGAIGDDKDFRDFGLWSGTLWSEESVGTNGIGTALADQRASTIYRDQHFLSSNINLSCAGAPIRDHNGRIRAALDISTCRDDTVEATMSILSSAVRDCAMRIETNLFRRAFPHARIVMVSHSGPNALIAVDRHDIVLGANRAARLALKLDDSRISAGLPAADLLGEVASDDAEGLEDAERAAIRQALSRANGNVSRAAVKLGISRATMHRKIRRLGLN